MVWLDKQFHRVTEALIGLAEQSRIDMSMWRNDGQVLHNCVQVDSSSFLSRIGVKQAIGSKHHNVSEMIIVHGGWEVYSSTSSPPHLSSSLYNIIKLTDS
jgi:hypothetical protein